MQESDNNEYDGEDPIEEPVLLETLAKHLNASQKCNLRREYDRQGNGRLLSVPLIEVTIEMMLIRRKTVDLRIL